MSRCPICHAVATGIGPGRVLNHLCLKVRKRIYWRGNAFAVDPALLTAVSPPRSA